VASSQASRPASPTPAASPSTDRVAGWRSDLDRLVGDLKDTAATATDDELMVGVVRAVALVSAHGRDSHTGLYPWSPASHYPVHSLPLRLWLFPDGVHVIAALAPYEDLVGARVDSVAGQPIGDVMRALDPLIPRDNETTVRLLTPRFLLMPEVLHGLGLVSGVGPLELGVVDASGSRRTVSIAPIAMADYNAWAGPYGLFLPADPKVRYLSRMDEPLWWTRLEDGTLYVQYNRVDPLDTEASQLAAAAAASDVTRVVVDIRHNYGGEVNALIAILDALATPKLGQAGRLFLITGRNTYSAASLFAAKLQARTRLTVVGEPMGGSPNLWGNAEDFSLPWSGLSVGVATQFELATSVDDVRLTIEPDLPVPLTFADWSAGRDPALEVILARKPT
jgi:hypothetical protein